MVDLVESAYRGDASRAGWTTEADLLEGQRTDPEEVVALTSDPAARLVLAFETEQLVGSVLVRAAAADTAYIGMFAVRPRLQAQGVGRALLLEAERVAREELGATRTKMTVIEQRVELLAWYARRGYQSTGEFEPFPYGNERMGVPQRDDLRFVVLHKRMA